MATNNILVFGGLATNELNLAAYTASSQRTNGNQPGVASSQLVNKGLHQISTIAAGVAQYLADRQATNVDDTLTPAQISTMLQNASQGQLIRTTVFLKIAGVQNVIVDGAAATTTGATVFTSHSLMKFALVESLGAGGGGAGAGGAAAGNVSLGAPGSCGSYGLARFLAATIAGAQSVTVGGGGAGGGASGATGATSSFGALLTAPGGLGGGTLTSQAPPSYNGNGGSASSPTGANLLSVIGLCPFVTVGLSASAGYGGAGGSSMYGQGAPGPAFNTNGVAAVNPGAGGSGCIVNTAGGTATGGAGMSGMVIVREYA